MTIEIIRREHIVDHHQVITWAIEWHGPRQTEPNVLRFLTRAEAEATRDAITQYCDARDLVPQMLPFPAVIILVESLKRGRDGIKFIVAESMRPN